jgi:glutamyl-tRNA(Gln) amidotransferase subunit E
MNYKKIGLMCGIEIHQQLDTHKLFCSCGTSMGDQHKAEVTRKLRAVVGELGEVDLAATQEALKGRRFIYRAYRNESCLVEADCEPPHNLNQEALDTTLMVSGLLNCFTPDEIHVMRKTVIDGSNTTGFQRTALVGLEGWVESSGGRVGIDNVSVEEDAAQILDRSDGTVTYGLDRLGIPLIEIGTSPDIRSPEQAREVAQKMGMILRSTGRVKRGLGTIRQDINISIKGGRRVEIKGAQELNMIPAFVENEARRQMSLLEIRRKLTGFKPMKPGNYFDATPIFRQADSKITKGKKTYALVIPGFAGLFRTKLTPGRTLGNEIASYVRARTDVKGFIHSDEDLSKYGLEKQFGMLRSRLQSKENDLLIIASSDQEQARVALQFIINRVNLLAEGVPKETRKALDDGNTEYMRPLPGAARMYPETDVPPIEITPGRMKEIIANLPETWDRMIERFMKQYGLNNELSKQVVLSGLGSSFEELVKIGVEPKLVATTITSGLKDLKTREAVPIERITDKHVLEVFRAFKKGMLNRENILAALAKCSQNPDADMAGLLGQFESKAASEEELRTLIDLVIKEKPDVLKMARPEQVYMGLVMAKAKGKASGQMIMRILSEEVAKARKRQ